MSHILDQLADIIAARKTASPKRSHTAQLLSSGIEKCAQKFGEEAIEAVIALTSGDKPAITAEAADVLYHLLVALEAAGVDYKDVLVELERRTGQSGLAEKAARKPQSQTSR